MCGIAGVHIKSAFVGNEDVFPIEDIMDGLLLEIEHRGQDATGFVAVTNGGDIKVEKDDVRASLFVQLRDWLPKDVRTVLLHTRFATQGEPKFMENNHPVQFGSCFAVHNGHISNDRWIVQAVLDSRNMDKRPAEVDSIAIPMIVDEMGFDNAEEAFKELYGGCATAVIDPVKNPGELIVARVSSSPLFVLNHRYALIWASTRSAIEHSWQAFIGTPPAKDKIREIEEGMIIRVKDDEVEEKRFKEKYTYTSYSSRHRSSWWGREDDTERYIAAQDYSRDAALMCFECGDSKATTALKDDSDPSVYWFTPLCWPCRNKVEDDASKLTYAHCKSELLKLYFTKDKNEDDDTKKCDLCNYFYATVFTSEGSWCRDCEAFEKRHQEVQGEIGVTVTTDSGIEVIGYGDNLPQSVSNEWKFCENCEDYPPTICGDKGRFLCLDCFEIEDDLGLKAVCSSCMTPTSVFSTIMVDGREICIPCEEAMFPAAANPESEDRADDPFPGTTPTLRPYLQRALQEMGGETPSPSSLQVAQQLGLPAVFVSWLLYSASLADLDCEEVLALHNEVVATYEEGRLPLSSVTEEV